jgi:hypothetical protein
VWSYYQDRYPVDPGYVGAKSLKDSMPVKQTIGQRFADFKQYLAMAKHGYQHRKHVLTNLNSRSTSISSWSRNRVARC